MARTSSRSAGFALITIGTLLWGTGGVAGSLVAGNSTLPLPSVSAVRLLAGGTLLLAAAAATGRTRRMPRTPAAARRIAATAVLTAVMTAAYFQALALDGVAVATALALGIAPLSVAGYTAIRTRRMPAPRIQAALAAGTAGLALVCGAPQARTSPAALACGVVLAAVSAIAFAAITIMNRRVVPGLTPVPLLGISFVLAGLISLAWSLPAGIDLGSLNRTGWGALGVLTLFQTTAGHLAFYAGLQQGVSSTAAAVLSLLEPVAATILAIVLLGQHLALLAGAGIVILLAAVLLVREPDAAPRKTTADSTPDACLFPDRNDRVGLPPPRRIRKGKSGQFPVRTSGATLQSPAQRSGSSQSLVVQDIRSVLSAVSWQSPRDHGKRFGKSAFSWQRSRTTDVRGSAHPL